MLQRRVEGTEEAAARAELLRQLGDVHRSELGAHELSVGTYAKALEVDPRNVGARGRGSTCSRARVRTARPPSRSSSERFAPATTGRGCSS